jgi:hypothetical protein
MLQLHVERNLRRVDLNLLVAFDVLMTERSVTRAARRLSIGAVIDECDLGKAAQAVQRPRPDTPRQGPNTYAARRVAGHTGARAVDRVETRDRERLPHPRPCFSAVSDGWSSAIDHPALVARTILAVTGASV